MIKNKRELLSDFQEFYLNEAKPLLPKYEMGRKKDKPVLIMVFLVMSSMILAIIIRDLAPFFLILTFILTFILMGMCKGKGEVIDMDCDSALKQKLMPSFLSLFGNFKWSKYNMGTNYSQYFKGLAKDKVFPDHFILGIDDTITGMYNDVEIKIYEIISGMTPVLWFIAIFFGSFLFPFVLFIIVGIPFLLLAIMGLYAFIIILPLLIYAVVFLIKKFITYDKFRGVVVELKMNKYFKGKTILYENKRTNRAVKNMNKKGYGRVILEDVDFNRRFEVYSTDQIEARYLLTTAFMERFKNIELAFKANFIRASFRDNRLFLVIGVNKDLFAMGNIATETNLGTFREMFEELYSVLELVDDLKLNENTGL